MMSCEIKDIFQKSSSFHFRGATPNSKTSVFSLTACVSTRYGPWKCMEIGVLFKQTVLFFHQTLTSASHKEGTTSKRMHRLPLIFQGKALSFGGEQCDHEPCVGVDFGTVFRCSCTFCDWVTCFTALKASSTLSMIRSKGSNTERQSSATWDAPTWAQKTSYL